MNLNKLFEKLKKNLNKKNFVYPCCIIDHFKKHT